MDEMVDQTLKNIDCNIHIIKFDQIARNSKKNEDRKKDVYDRNLFDWDPHQHKLLSIDTCLMKKEGHYFKIQARKMKRRFFGYSQFK